MARVSGVLPWAVQVLTEGRLGTHSFGLGLDYLLHVRDFQILFPMVLHFLALYLCGSTLSPLVCSKRVSGVSTITV
jgi:hypothetical protein